MDTSTNYINSEQLDDIVDPPFCEDAQITAILEYPKHMTQTNLTLPNTDQQSKTQFDEKQFIKLTCYGKETTACIDTGSGISLIDKATYKKLVSGCTQEEKFGSVLIKYDPCITLRTLEGSVTAIGMTSLKVNIGGCDFRIAFQVLEKNALEIILGCDFMRESLP